MSGVDKFISDRRRIRDLEWQRDRLAEALEAMLDAQSKRRHPLGAPNEGIAVLCAEAASKARAALAEIDKETSK